MISLPCDIAGLSFQSTKDIKTNRFFPVLALSQDQVFTLWIKSCNVDFILGIPIPTQFGELERPCVIDIQFPHPLLTDILIYETDVAGSESFADLIHHDTAMPAFNKAHIGIDKCEPKPQIVILDLVKAALALFGVFLCDRNLSLQNIQIYQSLQVLGQVR